MWARVGSGSVDASMSWRSVRYDETFVLEGTICMGHRLTVGNVALVSVVSSLVALSLRRPGACVHASVEIVVSSFDYRLR